MCDNKIFHIAMYPWFAMGHLTSFLHISNKLAERGHMISFFLPTKTQPKLAPFNLHPNLINFLPIALPQVDGLPPGAETTSDVPFSFHPLLMTAMDLTKPFIESFLHDLKPHFIFYDFTHWLPSVTRQLGIKAIHYCTISPATVGYLISPERELHKKMLTEATLLNPPQSFPDSSIKLHVHEARGLASGSRREYGINVSFMDRQIISVAECDAITFKTCREIEGAYINYFEKYFQKPAFLAGPVVPEKPSFALEEKWANWLERFGHKTVIFCSFGSECILKKDQFEELVLGFEMTGLPFFAALKLPEGFSTIESALPEGFEERVKGRGVIHFGWVQQQIILGHPSVGCFVTHCGSGSLSEAMVTECQLVLLPHVGDQFINARMMSGDMRVGVEIERGEENGLFTRASVCKAVREVMDDGSEVGKEVRRNHGKWREFLLSEGLESWYIDDFVQKLQDVNIKRFKKYNHHWEITTIIKNKCENGSSTGKQNTLRASTYRGDLYMNKKVIEMFDKYCGSMVNAHRVFDHMPEKDMGTWHLMINEYAKNGLGDDGL